MDTNLRTLKRQVDQDPANEDLQERYVKERLRADNNVFLDRQSFPKILFRSSLKLLLQRAELIEFSSDSFEGYPEEVQLKLKRMTADEVRPHLNKIPLPDSDDAYIEIGKNILIEHIRECRANIVAAVRLCISPKFLPHLEIRAFAQNTDSFNHYRIPPFETHPSCEGDGCWDCNYRGI